MVDPEPLERRRERLALGGERIARRVDPEDCEAEAAVSLLPGDHVGKRPHAVELGEVEEVDEHWPGHCQLGERGLSLGVQPANPSRQLRRGYVGAVGAQGVANQ